MTTTVAGILHFVKPPIFCMADFLHMADHRCVPEISETIHKAQVGRRLRDAIEALEITQTAVGEALGVSQSKLGNWLRGDNYPSVWFVKQFCDRYGITTEWIYRGIVTGMRSDLADKLWLSENAEMLLANRTPASIQQATRKKKRAIPEGGAPPRPLSGESAAKSAGSEGRVNIVTLRPVPA